MKSSVEHSKLAEFWFFKNKQIWVTTLSLTLAKMFPKESTKQKGIPNSKQPKSAEATDPNMQIPSNTLYSGNFIKAIDYPNPALDIPAQRAKLFLKDGEQQLGYILNPLGLPALNPWGTFFNRIRTKSNNYQAVMKNLISFVYTYILLSFFLDMIISTSYGTFSKTLFCYVIQCFILYFQPVEFFGDTNSCILLCIFGLTHVLMWVSFTQSLIFGYRTLKIISIGITLLHATYWEPYNLISVDIEAKGNKIRANFIGNISKQEAQLK